MPHRTRIFIVAAALAWVATVLHAQERRLHIAAPPELVETGFLRHLLPRFSLKHSTPITLVEPGDAAQAGFARGGGVPVFEDDTAPWHLVVSADSEGNPHVQRFTDWLASEIAARAIEGFAGPPRFTQALAVVEDVAEAEIDGDLARGAELSLLHCGRCHVVGPRNTMAGVGSTPSFAVLRTFEDWDERFEAFYVLKPHPSFSQVEGVTPPFPEERRPTIAPVRLTLEELADIMAYTASLVPADLGAPIQHQ
ncbi:hypothetical protein R3X27_19680 [Tropicimonas sp. TH_r6]|uniref:hypothetical protein n=1 Tax=Tropicimonas sp. TH_r6 TaxID=3082085 RepID=UPI002952BD2E|nr:hypothetical protein [Tropicimonas sp. TH_r6]MDV7144907.1 hypothetical protein [Tropicimonas sp. TH_r6]